MQTRNGTDDEAFINDWTTSGEPDLWRDFAFFDPDVGQLTRHLLGRGDGNLVFDFKWDESPDGRHRARRYLRHITMLSHADVIGDQVTEAPEKIEWHFSRPISMGRAAEYEKELAEAVEGQPEWHTESKAALAYFAEKISGTGTIVVLGHRGAGVRTSP